MEPTTEMRWWWRGSPSPEVDAWFAGLRGAVRDEARTDHYLALASDADTGIKARAGERLEIKTLRQRQRAVAIADGVVGTLEQWVKWSFPLADGTPDEEDLDQDRRTWIRTSKHRWLVTVDNCDIELAEADLAGQRWWSLAGEADGEGAAGRERLVAALTWLAAAEPPPRLELVDGCSHGYAELLLRLQGDSEGEP